MPTLVQRPSTGSNATAAKRRPARRLKIFLAALLALLLHAALIVLLAWALPHWPRPPLKKRAAPLQLMIQPSEPAETPGLHKTETVPQQPAYIRTIPSQEAATPPPDPKFISARDTVDASEKAAEDPFKPLPTQDGREAEAFDFVTNPYLPGKITDDTAADAAPAPAVASTPPPATPKPDAKESPTPPPAATPPSTPGDFLTLKADASPANTPPEPSPTPKPRSSSTPPEDALARQAARVARENQTVRSTGLQLPSGQPQTTQTKMSGSVDNRGKSSPRAVSTPLGRYEKAMEDAVAERWYQLVNERMGDLIKTENVKIHFFVTRAGKAITIRASGRNENTVLSTISMQAIAETDLPPIPDDVAALLPEGQLEVDYTFGMFEN